MNNLDEINKLTLSEYEILMEAQRLKSVDEDLKIHKQAYLTFLAKAEKKTGKNKLKPVYTTFQKFYNYEKALEEAQPQRRREDKLEGLRKFIRKGGENV